MKKHVESPTASQDRPALTDVVITPAMLIAGIAALSDSCDSSSAGQAKSVFEAMIRVACAEVDQAARCPSASFMSDTDQKREDDVLRRMLNTKPKPHKPKESDDKGRLPSRGVR